MHRIARPIRFPLLVAIMAVLGMFTATATAAQDVPAPQPVDIPCAHNVIGQLLNATPVGDGSQTLVLVRIIFGPGGTLGNHTHPGTLAVTIESGSFGLTLAQDGEMGINRGGPASADATPAPMTPGQQYTLAPGDGFIETGMVHSAANLSDGDTTVLLAGLIETGQPLTQCADNATPMASAGQHG
jgi:quercetin dioxygenase-like cupin family protein